MINRLEKKIKELYPDIRMLKIHTRDLVFEESVKLNCFYCGKYGQNWRCPPRLPEHIDYRKVFEEYENAAFVYVSMAFDENSYDLVRSESSVILHKALLKMEKLLWEENCPTALSFIGGSCKLCKNGCGKEQCNNPYMARSPLEAAGVNVMKSAGKYGIKVIFPPKNEMLRIGLLLW